MINTSSPFECSRCDRIIRTNDLTYLAYDGMICVECQHSALVRDIGTSRSESA